MYRSKSLKPTELEDEYEEDNAEQSAAVCTSMCRARRVLSCRDAPPRLRAVLCVTLDWLPWACHPNSRVLTSHQVGVHCALETN